MAGVVDPLPEGIVGVHFESGGHQLIGTLHQARGRGRAPTAIILHGVPGIEKNLDMAAALRDDGWNALVFHYRGCWGSAGPWRLETIPEDVIAATDFVVSRPEVDPERLVLVGHSGGGWAAVVAAAHDRRVRGVAVYGAAAALDTRRWTREVVEREFTPWLSITPEQFLEQQPLPASMLALEQAGAIAPRPLLVVHGTEDSWVPLAEAEQLYERASDPRRLVVVEGANHSFAWHRAELIGHILRWLRETQS